MMRCLICLGLVVSVGTPVVGAPGDGSSAWMPFESRLYEVDLDEGTTLQSIEMSEPIAAAGVTWSASGDLLAVGEDLRLVAIDPDTGVVTERVEIDLPNHGPMGLAEDACGRLFLGALQLDPDEVQILRLDPETGATEQIASLPTQLTGALTARGRHLFLIHIPSPFNRAVLRIDPDTGARTEIPLASNVGDTAGLDFAPDGYLWHAQLLLGPGPPTPVPVHRIDLADGSVVSLQGALLDNFAIAPAAGTCVGSALPIPAATPVGLLALALALAAAGAFALSHRRTPRLRGSAPSRRA